MMRSLPGLAIASLVVISTMAGGCASAKAQAALPDSAPLTIPMAPSRVVVPAPPDPPPAPVETAPVSTSTLPANPPANPTRPNRDPKPPAQPPVTPPAANPPAAPTAPTTPLETQGNQNELEQKTRGLLGSAKGTLLKINKQALSADGKAQYDAADRFVKQAEDALVAKNYVYAWQLADKANTIATLLLRHS
jgi:hypothetical protein